MKYFNQTLQRIHDDDLELSSDEDDDEEDEDVTDAKSGKGLKWSSYT